MNFIEIISPGLELFLTFTVPVLIFMAGYRVVQKARNLDWIGAYYDPETDLIHGCTRNTLVWHHEDRHRQQYNNQYVEKLAQIFFTALEGISLGWVLICLPFQRYELMLKLIGVTALPHIALSTGMEIDAWLYMLRKYLEGDYKSV